MTTIGQAAALMARLNVRRVDDTLQCPHVRTGMDPETGKARRYAVVTLWDLGMVNMRGEPHYSSGFLCADCLPKYAAVCPQNVPG